jgi:hypothetical protein
MISCVHIPFCRAEFLQDVSIELGRRFAAGHPFRSFSAEVSTCEHQDHVLERLSVWASTHYGTTASLALWDDGTVWVCIRLCAAENNGEYSLGFYPQCQGFTPEQIAEAFRDTVSLSTRLCYAETPLPTLRCIWKHDADVKTSGELKRS